MARKRRSLVNGRYYKNRSTMQMAHKRSEQQKKAVTSEQMKALSDLGNSAEARAKKSETLKLYFKNNPGEFSRRITMAYEKNPELRVKRAKVLRISRTDMENYYTDAENAEKRRTYKDGKQVVRYVQGKRIPSTGVLVQEED